MPFSAQMGTPLSNFEANLNYKEVDDPSLVVEFSLTKSDSLYILGLKSFYDGTSILTESSLNELELDSNASLRIYSRVDFSIDLSVSKISSIFIDELFSLIFFKALK